jgi:glutathione synthase/RimK-type ligase-like ATP-grasp enzyme
MRPRIALATYERAPLLAPDDQTLIATLAAEGIDGEPAVWSDDSVIWETFDGIVIRSCWDYHLRSDEFFAWLDRLDASRLPMWNSSSLVQWNSHKRYLLDLAQRGIATIPTTIVPRGTDAAAVESIVNAEGWQRFALKPAVSASGFETHALSVPFSPTDHETVERVTTLGDVLVQPFAEEVPRDGELSLMFIDGEFSHSAIKRASGGEFRVQTEHGGSVKPMQVAPPLIEQAKRVIEALPEVPLYARVDGIVRGDAFLLMELELIEPNLFFDISPGSAERFASALSRRLRDA